MHIEDYIYIKDLQHVTGEKPENMSNANWNGLDRKALGVLYLSLSYDVASNITKETTMPPLANMYKKTFVINKLYPIIVYLI